MDPGDLIVVVVASTRHTNRIPSWYHTGRDDTYDRWVFDSWIEPGSAGLYIREISDCIFVPKAALVYVGGRMLAVRHENLLRRN